MTEALLELINHGESRSSAREGLMFRDLMNFSYQRTALQALGWYMTFLLTFILVGGLLSSEVATAIFFTRPTTPLFDRIPQVAWWFAVVYVILLATALLWSRRKSALNVFLALVAVLLSLLFAAPGGLIPLAVLTTRPREKFFQRDRWRLRISQTARERGASRRQPRACRLTRPPPHRQ